MKHFAHFLRFRTGSILALLVLINLLQGSVAQGQITTVSQLTNAVNNGAANAEIVIGAGTFELTAPLRPKAGMTIRGAGKGQTIIKGAASWNPGTADLPDGEVDWKTRNQNAYLFDLGEGIPNVTISDMTLTGPQLHGAVLGLLCDSLELYNLRVEHFQWSGIRTFIMKGAKIHENTFVDAGGTHKGASGGAMFLTYASFSELWNNDISYGPEPTKPHYGIKGRELRNSRIHHNTIKVDFSIELPFEYDYYVDIDHNYLGGVVSIPRYAGGPVPDGGYTFHIHHNYFTTPYALEWPKNGVEVDHNLFNFSVNVDYGNLISNFAGAPAAGGPTKFHDNLIKNPGLGVVWMGGLYNNFSFYNNHVLANETITPRTQGLFEFWGESDYSTIAIRDNIIECVGLARPLMRTQADYAAVISNNKFVNISDTDKYANPQTGAIQGPLERLNFKLGANEKYTINQWEISGEDPVPPFDASVPQTLFTTQTPRDFPADARYELGTKFRSLVNGTISKVRIYAGSEEAGEHTVRIWRVADKAVLAGPFSWTITPGSAGWKEFPLPSALAITANTDYIVAVSNGPDNRYVSRQGGFDSGLRNGNLMARGNSGVFSTTLGEMPTQTFASSNYFRDVVFLAAPAPGTGTGLSATYYDNKNFTGTTVTRTDATVDFNWGTGSPAAGLGADEFSVRWQGRVEAPVTGSYTFSTTSDDGVRLWINGNQVINNWTDHAPTTNNSASITLTAGTTYDIMMEYYENRGGAVARLLWCYPNQSRQVIPSRWLYPATGTSSPVAASQQSIGADAEPLAVSVYPNPASSEVTVQHQTGKIVSIIITDALGRVSYRQTGINRDKAAINTSSLQRGNHYVRIESDTGNVEVQRLVIEK